MNLPLKQLAALTLLAMSQFALADEASLKKALEAAYPKFKIESVIKTPYTGLYEVFMGGQMIYTDENNSHPGSLLIDEAGSKWHLANSIKLGTDSKTLQSLNQKPFTFYGFYWDYGGVITEWNGGALSKKTVSGSQINIHLCPPEDPKLPENYLMGDGTFNSDNPLAVKFPPVVCKLGVYFPVDEKK